MTLATLISMRDTLNLAIDKFHRCEELERALKQEQDAHAATRQHLDVIRSVVMQEQPTTTVQPCECVVKHEVV